MTSHLADAAAAAGTPGVGNYRVCLQVFLLCDLSI